MQNESEEINISRYRLRSEEVIFLESNAGSQAVRKRTLALFNNSCKILDNKICIGSFFCNCYASMPYRTTNLNQMRTLLGARLCNLS